MIKKFLEEFKAFALRGNVVDMAIGVLIGGTFSGLVGAFTTNIVQPILDIIGPSEGLGWVIPLGGASAGLQIGAFISAVINFVIMAFIIFMVMKTMNALMNIGKKEEVVEEEAPAPAPTTEELLTEIIELLKNK